MSIITFKKSIDNYLPIYYHFLDGYINPNIGFDKDKVYSFITNHQILPSTLDDSNKFITLLDYTINKTSIILIFTVFKPTKNIIFTFNFDEDIKSRTDLSEIIELFKYCICNVINNSHATSLVTFINNNTLNIASFNSGLGINYHNIIFNDGIKNYFSPYIGIKLYDDISKNIVDGIKTILSFLIISDLYNKIENFKNLYEITIYQKYKFSEKIDAILYYNCEPLINLIEYLKILDKINLDDVFKFTINNKTLNNLYKIKLIDVYYSGNTLYINEQEYTTETKQHRYIKTSEMIITEEKLSYYNIITNIFKKLFKKFNEYRLPITKSFNDTRFSNFNTSVKNKLILHNHKTYYIHYQESGSCTWFSIYWPIIFFNIFNFNEENYYNTIIYIYEKFIKLLNNIFTPANFLLCYNNDYDYIYMKILCEKLITIKLLDSSILEQEVDFIYNLDILIEYNIDKTINTIDSSIINEIKQSDKTTLFGSCNIIDYIKKLYKSNFSTSFYIFSDIKIKINNNRKEINSFNNTIILIQELFLYSNEKCIDMFNKECPNPNILSNLISDLKIDSIINQYYKDLFENDFENDYYFKIDEIPYNLNNYIIQFIDTYDEHKIKDLMYINNYIYWASTISFIDSNELLLKFIIFIHRFSLFILIFRTLNFIIETSFIRLSYKKIFISPHTKKQYIKKIYNSILIPLLNNNSKEYDIIDFDTENNLNGYIHNIYYDLKYINHFININNTDKTIPCKECISFLDFFSRKIEDYNKLKIFLYKNPKYIHQDFNNNEFIINSNQFVKININEICKNKIYKTNLIQYYAIKYYEIHNNDSNNELFWIISNLQLLITEKVGYIDDDKNPDIIIYNAFVYEYSECSFDDFKIRIEEIYNKKTKEEFCDYLITKKLEFNIINLLKKHINEDILYNNITNDIIINGEIYKQKNFTNNNKLTDFFNIIPGTIYLFNQKKDSIRDIYIFNEKLYIQLFCNFNQSDKINNFIIKIINIKVNNEDVIKYNSPSIIYPWKYVIPTSCFHLIYLKNNIFHITYFVNNNRIKIKENLNGEYLLNNDIYIITINKDNMMFPNLDNSNFKNICYDYGINKYNIIYLNDNNTKEKTNVYLNEKYYNEFKFNKTKFLIKHFSETKYKSLKLLNDKPKSIITFIKVNEPYLEEIKKQDKDNIFTKSIEKLSFKINECVYKYNDKQNLYAKDKYTKLINYIYTKINKLKIICDDEILSFTNCIKDKYIYELFEDYNELYNYLLSVKKLNLCNTLLEIVKLGKLENICSQLKIYNNIFDVKQHKYLYMFEPIFELITGNEIYAEQVERYISIISEFNTFKKKSPYITLKKEISDIEYILDYTQVGGKSYPLHHFMMAKGKSTIITPLLSLYFRLIHKNIIFIIVPEHLIIQTDDIINGYIDIFNIKKYIMDVNPNKIITIDEYRLIFTSHDLFIFSDSKIKELFLLGLFNNNEYNQNVIMLIDEFDYILDPIKSNFNITTNKTIQTINEFNLLNPIKSIEENICSIQIGEINEHIECNMAIEELIKKDIKSIINQINIGKLKENIHWGIHPDKCIAIPYRCKDTPLLNSNFSSIILTIYLTLYYYIVIKKYKTIDIIVNYIKKNNLFKEFFPYDIPIIFSVEILEDILNSQTEKYRLEFYNFIFNKIFSNFKISDNQQNTSFIDIINIDNIFKIGYSGTLNINLPELKSEYNFEKIIPDYDEKINVEYAILKSVIIPYLDYNQQFFFNSIDFFNYDALIDIVGLFKNERNEYVATEISEYFKKKLRFRDVIYINEKNEIYVIKSNSKKEKYDKYYYYNEPFMFYSNAHTIGIDIKQDLYPTMIGLCIINNLSEYTQIAQGIFRLRKLNMGHSIHFLYLNKKVSNQELLDIINYNETQNKQEKNDYLIYQTIKSEIRKKSKDYLEPIKYYHLEYKDNIKDILNDIISINDITKYKLIKLFNKINNIDKIKKLVYNINSISIVHSVEKSNDQSKENEESISKTIIQNNEKKIIISADLFYDYIKYDFDILDTLEGFNNSTIMLENFLHFLPNIFTHTNTYRFSFNLSGYVFVYFNTYNKILIIPGYLIIFFEKKYPILDYRLLLLNINLIGKYNKELIKNNFLKTILFNLLNHQPKKINTYSGYIVALMICNNNYISEYQNKLLTFFSKDINCITYKKRFIESLNSKYFIDNSIKFIKDKPKLLVLEDLDDLDDIDSKYKKVLNKEKDFKEKALKYKLKYLKLKQTI